MSEFTHVLLDWLEDAFKAHPDWYVVCINLHKFPTDSDLLTFFKEPTCFLMRLILHLFVPLVLVAIIRSLSYFMVVTLLMVVTTVSFIFVPFSCHPLKFFKCHLSIHPAVNGYRL